MSARELSRVEVLSRVKAGALSLRSAATLLGVSYRQAKRLARRYGAEGAKGLRARAKITHTDVTCTLGGNLS